MKVQISLLACTIVAGCSALSSPPRALPPAGDVDLTTVTALYGFRTLDDDDFWANVDETNTIGVEIDHRARGAWFGFELGTQLSDGDDDGAKSDVDEIYAGVRKTFDFEEIPIHPYIAVGISYVQAQAAVEVDLGAPIGLADLSSDDESVGGYARVGVFGTLMERVNIGVEYRLLFGTDMDLFGASTDVDYGQIGVTLGYSF